MSYPPILPDDILGHTFGTGPGQGETYFKSSRRLVPSTPVESLLGIAAGLPNTVPQLDLPPPPPATARVLLELDPDSLAPEVLLWVSVGGWNLLITNDNQMENRGLCRQGLDPRIPRGEMTASYQLCLGAGGSRSVIRALDRVALRAVR